MGSEATWTIKGYRDIEEKILEAEYFDTSLEKYGLNPSLSNLRISIPQVISDAEKRQIVNELNSIPGNTLHFIANGGVNPNALLAFSIFTLLVQDCLDKYNGETKANSIDYMAAAGSKFSGIVQESAENIKKFDKICRTPINELKEITDFVAKDSHKGLQELLKNKKYAQKSLYELARAAKSKTSKKAFRKLFYPLQQEIDNVACSLKSGAYNILDGHVNKIKSLFNSADEKVAKEIGKVYKQGLVLASIEDTKNLMRYAKYGKLFDKGLMGINIINAYSNLLTEKSAKAGRTAWGDTGYLVGSTVGSMATGAVLDGIALELIGTALIGCGPLGWGILAVGAAISVVVGSQVGEQIRESCYDIWDEYIVPNKEGISNWGNRMMEHPFD